MGQKSVVVEKTSLEEGLSLNALINSLTVIRDHLNENGEDFPTNEADKWTVVVVGEDVSWTINEVSFDNTFIRLEINYKAPAVHPDQ